MQKRIFKSSLLAMAMLLCAGLAAAADKKPDVAGSTEAAKPVTSSAQVKAPEVAASGTAKLDPKAKAEAEAKELAKYRAEAKADAKAKAKARIKAKPKAVPPGKLVDVNSASKADLMKLPGIGAPEADKIIAGRPYLTKSRLITQDIVSVAIFENISPRIIAKQK